jgi:hypothetical protein
MVRIYDYIGDCGLGAEGCLGMPLGKMDRREIVFNMSSRPKTRKLAIDRRQPAAVLSAH